jgi:hypothetical protein
MKVERYEEMVTREHVINEYKSTLDTAIQVKDTKNGKLILANLKNMTVLGGRVKIQEDIYGLTPNPNNHLILNRADMLNIPHSVDTFQSGQALNRRTKWFMIGTGGENPAQPLKIFSPKNYETKLYNAVPFRCVPLNADLAEADAAQYRFRKPITIAGNQYWAYYLKAFTVEELVLTFNENNYVPIVDDTVPVSANDTSHRLSGGKVLCVSRFNLTVTENEFKEWYRLTNQGNLSGARLSELGLAMGIDAVNEAASGRLEVADAELTAKLTHSPVFMDEEGSSRVVEYKIYT